MCFQCTICWDVNGTNVAGRRDLRSTARRDAWAMVINRTDVVKSIGVSIIVET